MSPVDTALETDSDEEAEVAEVVLDSDVKSAARRHKARVSQKDEEESYSSDDDFVVDDDDEDE